MEELKRKKVGIMGGTFDPIHIGHLILAEHAYHQFELDAVLFMPSGNPPHKKDRFGRASTAERVAMVALAIEDNPHFVLSLEETDEHGFTYTAETLKRLTHEHPDTDYFFILGADSLFTFETWKDPQQICAHCTIIVAMRNHISSTVMAAQITHLEQLYDVEILTLDTPNMEISSGDLRTHAAKNRSLRYYTPAVVANYIKEKQLYMECEEE